MRTPLVFLFLIGLVGCAKDSTGSNTHAFPASRVTGTWTVVLGDSFPCPDSVPERTFLVNVSGNDDDILPAGSLSFADTWTSPSGVNGVDYGTINVDTRLVLIHLVAQDSLTRALELKAFIDDTLGLHGRAVDPYAGYSPLLTTAGCEFDLSGRRTSP
ncbi:MAG: hypothetical protein ABI679_00435 [Gemmatimonadota bacterium]